MEILTNLIETPFHPLLNNVCPERSHLFESCYTVLVIKQHCIEEGNAIKNYSILTLKIVTKIYDNNIKKYVNRTESVPS
jgi:hypothetical protein